MKLRVNITVVRTEKALPLIKALPDPIWEEEIKRQLGLFLNTMREFGDVYWEEY